MAQNEVSALSNVDVIVVEGDIDAFVTDTNNDNAKFGYRWTVYVYDSTRQTYLGWMKKYKDDTHEWYITDTDVEIDFRTDTFYIGMIDEINEHGLVTVTSAAGEVKVYGYVLKYQNGVSDRFQTVAFGKYSSRLEVDGTGPKLAEYMKLFSARGDTTSYQSMNVVDYCLKKWGEY